MKKDNKIMDFLQSELWRNFQEVVGHKVFHVESEGPAQSQGIESGRFSASIIEHQLPMVGKYLYCPRGPVMEHGAWSMEQKSGMREMLALAKKENAGWVRIEPADKKTLELIKENISEKIIKAPHDMQPKEVFVMEIAKSPEQLLTEMKPKTRYNIGIAMKKGIVIEHSETETGKKEKELYLHAFLRLTKEMTQRHGIVAHDEEYYQKMVESLPSETLRIYVAKFEGKIIAANLMLFDGKTATYLHGASGNAHRNLMAPFLLQWQAILDAKEKGCTKYDFGGVKMNLGNNSWAGITQFKVGFSPKTKPIEFPGSYDIIINSRKYAVYRGLQRVKSFAVKFRR